jgi:plastocyanin
MPVQIQLRNDTAANWTDADPVLAIGEFGLERDTNQFKIGNGVDTWEELPYGGIAGEVGPAGAIGPEGPAGPAGAEGPAGPAGADGEAGPAGQDGTGISILGSLDGVEDLPATGNIGDAYLISSNLYVWDSINEDWVNAGSVQGPAGADGANGADGADGANGADGADGADGAVGINWQGDWDESVNYVVTDAVFYDGSSWFASTDPDLGSVPSDTSPYWSLLSAQGDQGPAGFTNFNEAGDAIAAGITIDEIAYSAVTRLEVTNSGTSAYLFNNHYSANNPTLFAIAGTTIAFKLNVASHPFLIRYSGANYNTGLIHVSTDGVVSTGSDAQGKTSGTLYWQIPANISGDYGYLCSIHGSMSGNIIVNGASPSAPLESPTFTGTVTGTPTAGSEASAATGFGYMGIPQSLAAGTTGSYTVAASDAGKQIYASATRTVTIPANGSVALPVGTTIVFIAGSGATMTIAITTDTLLVAGSGTGGAGTSRTLAPHGIATAIKVTSTLWYISGNGLS